MSEIFYPAALTCRFDQPFIKTVILLSVAAMGASRVLPKLKAPMSSCEPSTPKNGNGGWNSFPASKEPKNRFRIVCRK